MINLKPAILFLKFNAKIIYFIFKMFPIQNKIILISRLSRKTSIDFNLLEKEIYRRDPTINIVILNHKRKNAISHTFDILIEMYHLATSRVCIIDSYVIPVSILNHKEELVIIQLWHALGAIKKFGHAILDKREGSTHQLADLMDMHKNYDYVICGGEASIPFFAEAFNIEPQKIKPYSLPRVDYLLDEKQVGKNKEEIIRAYNQLKKRKTILYAPTFRKNDSLKIKDLINNIDFNNYNLIIKKHPLDKTCIEELENIIVDKHFSTLKLLSIANYVITDYSAVAFEAAVLNIPVYFYVYDIDKYQEYRGLNIDLFREIRGAAFKDAERLMLAIGRGDYNFEQLKKFKKKYINVIDQTSTNKIVDLIEEGRRECGQNNIKCKGYFN